MELKVWVEGIQRIVCGVTEATTCQDVVFALAHATGKSGRFTLIERWRNNERQLAPTENPMKILMKWGEYSNDVQFILQWSESKSSRPKISTSQPAPQLTNITIDSPERQQKSPNYNANTVDNVGVVKGIPQEFTNNKVEEDSVNKFQKIEESVLYNAQYRELVSLVNYQRDKLSSQQVDLTKFDAEIVFWEGKEREKQFQLDFIAQELATMTNASRINSDQIQALGYVEEEVEIVKQQEKTLKSEITLLRSKLANCETELLQCKNKIRLVMDEVQMEQRVIARRSESRKQLERNLLVEMERLQGDIELAKQSTELHHLTAESLKKEGVFVKVAALEAAIIEKKKQVEHLVTEMKEANLQSLTIAPQEELKQVFEGPNRAGSTRKMIGSPRQLENAVPTNKNPHGVWV
ncbi:PREDICTED: ras association domain-containing protein 8 isoform X5 [Nicrophorus vespilloides]|uniref:Ras association domain-containing protein 8 isoform X5 n=1 Tax=Nicrophorus vespilloides TaxID=110193 RepID=A0ABM1MHC0_NICVS|nr:PREDICTED: ras association domain-containing protein 8 isoform X5 [Nicrophorus vespilloides]